MPVRPITPSGIVLPPRTAAQDASIISQPQVNAARLVGIGRVTRDPAWRMSEHAHPMHEVIVILRGKLFASFDNQEISAGPGDVLWYAADRVHAERTDALDPVESYFIALHWSQVPTEWPVLRHDRSGFIRQQAAWLYAGRDDSNEHANDKRTALLHALLADYSELALNNAEDTDMVARVRARIRDDLSAPLTLDDLARAAGLSRSYFVRTFKRLAGRTPMDEMRRLRLDHVRDMLLGTDLPLRLIAERSGLGSEFLLSRLFRRQFGMPPGAFRSARAAAAATVDSPRKSRH